MLTSFLPIFIAGVIAFLLAVVMTVFAQYVGPRKSNRAKGEPYECGIKPEKPLLERFDVRYYVIAILFIGFDVEIIFLYPWAVAYDKLGLFGFVEMFIFAAILIIAYFYAVRNGIFEWGPTGGKKVVRQDNPWGDEEKE